MRLLATAAAGLEGVVAIELRRLGYADTRTRPGRVEVPGDWRDLAWLNLQLRSADRVKLLVGDFKATTFDQLFEGSRALPWEDLLPADAEFPVIGRSARSTLHSVPDCQAIVKRAVVEALRRRHRAEWFPEDGPLYRIEVALHDDQVELSIDSSGEGLHRRGYRRLTGGAPLRETLAAGILILAGWKHWAEGFVDLFTGSGTLAIEAALLARRQAPGLKRRFASMQWPQMPAALWRGLQRDAEAMVDTGLQVDLAAWDLDPAALDLARANAAAAGVAGLIRFHRGDAVRWQAERPAGLLVGNPPYGQRVGSVAEAQSLARALGEMHRRAGPGWRAFWLSGLADWETHYGRTADRRRKLYNAGIAAQLYQYQAPTAPRDTAP